LKASEIETVLNEVYLEGEDEEDKKELLWRQTIEDL